MLKIVVVGFLRCFLELLLISYINSFNTIIDFKTFFILLVSFFGILFLALFTKIIVKLITR